MSGDGQAVWVTTHTHLDRFKDLIGQTSFANKLRGRYVFPNDFPRLIGTAFGKLATPFPVIFLSTGYLTIGSDTICYVHRPTGNSRYAGLSDLSFSLPLRDLQSVSMITPSVGLFRYYDLPFIQLDAKVAGISGSPLVSALGQGPFVAKIKRRTYALFSELKTRIDSNAVA